MIHGETIAGRKALFKISSRQRRQSSEQRLDSGCVRMTVSAPPSTWPKLRSERAVNDHQLTGTTRLARAYARGFTVHLLFRLSSQGSSARCAYNALFSLAIIPRRRPNHVCRFGISYKVSMRIATSGTHTE